ncbi:LysE family translocator [Tamaricihabitans halophyticus]|uniref:LysE family translocator n=1 Tax=Tamaricihabitans halophyticus TaxID=1262583 RepID=UPI001A9FB45F|nr:LysE family translocator [Tamaricihabitans halophyticus]
MAVAASPGANNLLAFRNGLRSGFTNAVLALVGRFTAFVIMLGMVIAGLGTVLHTSQLTFEVLRIVGAAVMVAMGLWIIWSARAKPTEDDSETASTHRNAANSSPVKLAIQEFITAAANPKALLLFTAFLPPFVNTTPSATSAGAQLALLGALYIACEAATALAWAGSGRFLATHGITRRTLRRLEQASGAALATFGGGLAATDLSRELQN